MSSNGNGESIQTFYQYWRIAFFIVLTVFISGCASNHAWQHPEADRYKLSMDKIRCRKLAKKASERYSKNNSNLTRPMVYRAGKGSVREMSMGDSQRIERPVFRRCMREKGYSRDWK